MSLSHNTQCAITLTGGGVAENHTGMQKIGTQRDRGFSTENLIYLHQRYSGVLHKLDNEASVWVCNIRDVFGIDANDLYEEHARLAVDKKKKMYGRVMNAKARYNICYGDTPQEASYEEGRGRIEAFRNVPLLNKIRELIPQVLRVENGPDINNLMFEMNKYYDINECGIGFHGDTERRIVIGFRLGATIPLDFQSFKHFKPVGKRIHVKVSGGQFYIMNEKAVGFDWKNSKKLTWRHAAGAKKFRPSNEEILQKLNKKRRRKQAEENKLKMRRTETGTVQYLKSRNEGNEEKHAAFELPPVIAATQQVYPTTPVSFKCVQCGINMGDNPRQLCGKTRCLTQLCDE